MQLIPFFETISISTISSNNSTLCSPNEDFGKRNNRSGVCFRWHFQSIVAQIEYARPWKVRRKDTTDLLFCRPKSSFGEHKLGLRLTLLTKSSKWRFMLPKRRFWKSDPTFGNVFSKYFSKERRPNRVLTLWKVLRKYVPECWIRLPKSSFGEHKIV